MRHKKRRRKLWMKRWKENKMRETVSFLMERHSDVMQTGSFWLPSACQNLSIEYNLKPPATFLVFFLLKDPEGKLRFQKQLSYSTPIIVLGKSSTDTTIGGIPGEMMAGEWTIEIYLFSEYLEQIPEGEKLPLVFRISDEKKEVPETIDGDLWADETFGYSRLNKDRIWKEGTGWYKGDFHTHTQLSDGRELPGEAGKKAQKMGLDFYMATEHNVVHTGWPQTPVLVMPGVEITTIIGHANVFGLTRRPNHLTKILRDKDRSLLKKDIRLILEECREEGWLFSINHPFLHIWKWLYDEISLSDISCLEIINDPTYEADPEADAHEANEKAVFLSDLLWEDGYRICAIGGSDSHKKEEDWYPGADGPSIPGDPATFLYMEDLSERHVLDALQRCRSHVSRRCEITCMLTAQKEDGTLRTVVFGDKLKDGEEELSYKIIMRGQKDRPHLYYVRNGKRQECDCVSQGEDCWTAEGSISLSCEKYQWVRFGAESAQGAFLWYANPVSKGEKEHRFHTFGEVKGYLEEQWKSKEYYLTKMER
ncbi:MAG: CehA/McbA family metallohydrolase [Eubacteriales bacterium]|nr:CehA/McbA family metallohydrolase [Eubacteriales bacterium]